MKLLVALDSSEYSNRIINYVASAVRQDVQVRLFSVLDQISDKMVEQLHNAQFKAKVDELRKMEIGKASFLREQMEKYKEILIKAGIAEQNIDIHAQAKKVGIARDIMYEAERGGYDTVVVGRRGLSAASSLIFGSVSNKIIHNIKNCTVWVVE